MDVTKAASVRKVLFERMGLEAPSSKLTKKGSRPPMLRSAP